MIWELKSAIIGTYMGGSALKHIETRRVLKDEYFIILNEVTEKLRPFFTKVSDIPAYRQKESFGDLDILASEYNDKRSVSILLKDVFNYHELFHNGNCYSFDYKNLQIDLISVPLSIHEASRAYYSWNDLGNIMGRVAHRFGLAFGHEGLRYIYRTDDTHVIADITVSTDTQLILGFLGYDYFVWKKGFDTLEDIFNYAISTPYFRKDIFAFENLNHQNRTRNRKRDTYKKFVEWLETKEGLPCFNFHEDKNFYLKDILTTFANFEIEYNKATEKHKQHQLFKSKFNGDLVRTLTGFEGKDLGLYIVKLKNLEPNFEKFILESKQELINHFILSNK